MKLTSPAFQHNGMIPSKYTCDGDGSHTPLSWSDVPEGTKSFALLMEDPDVPKFIRPDGLWIHWVLFDIPGDVREIEDGDGTPGKPGVNTAGKYGYGGPCPPDAKHRYIYTIYALNKESLGLDQNVTKDALMKAIGGHVIDHTELIGVYEKKGKKV
ncbi:YbhB/YbcL family Raf kinase inhibitor-like protein [bacterium]|nr:YbhB/YbcL family Raf kinase inhibitor-like protein [bacterium]